MGYFWAKDEGNKFFKHVPHFCDFTRSSGTFGAIHSTKISGLRFENFLLSNGSLLVRKVSFHSTRKTSFTLITALWNKGFWITVARIRARWRFLGFRRWYQRYCVSCFIHSNLSSITGCFEQTVPGYLPYNFKHHVRIEWWKEHFKFSREINRL